MKKILLLGVGGNVSQGILKALRETKLDLYIIGACVSEYSSGLYLCDEAFISPYANSDDFIPWVINCCNSKEIDMIMTGVEENIIVLSKNIDEIQKNTKAIFISSNYEQLQIGQNKYRTCQWLKANGCNYPQFSALSDIQSSEKLVEEIGFPLIAKPNNGKSESGIYRINNQYELNEVLGLDNYVLEEYLPEDTGEYTVGCYCDKSGSLKDIIVMKRNLRKGTTVYSKVVHDSAIEEEAIKIVSKYKPIGPLNIQMRLNRKGQPVCFELNVRFSGSTAMRTNFGYKDVKAMVNEYLYNEPIDDCFNTIDGECFRYDNEFYLFDNQVSQMAESGDLRMKLENIVFDNNFLKQEN